MMWPLVVVFSVFFIAAFGAVALVIWSDRPRSRKDRKDK